MTLDPTYRVHIADDLPGAGDWGDDSTPGPRDPGDATLLHGVGPGDLPPLTIDDRDHSDAQNWRVIRIRHLEAISMPYRCEVTLAVYRPLAPEDKYTALDDPDTIFDDVNRSGGTPQGLLATFGPGGATSNRNIQQWVLGERRELRTDWAVSEPISPGQFIGRRMSVAITHESLSPRTGRYLTGLVTDFEDLGNTADPNFRVVNVTLQPQLWKLGLRTNCRVFSRMTAMEIVHAVLKDAGIYQGDRELSYRHDGAVGSTPDTWTVTREYTVQYNETDLDFVHRLLQEEGVAYVFDHRKLTEGVIFLEDFATAPLGAPALANVSPEQVRTSGAEQSWSMRLRKALRTQRFSARDYDSFQTTAYLASGPQSIPGASATGPEAYEYPARIPLQVTQGTPDTGLGDVHALYPGALDQDRATFRRDAEQVRAFDGRGKSNVLGLYAGSMASASGLGQLWTVAPDAGTFLITGVEHVGYPTLADVPDIASKLPASLTADDHVLDEKAGTSEYFNRFEFVPAGANATLFRPERRTPRPVIYGLQPAIVVDDEAPDYDPGALKARRIVAENIGRVKVRFLWDRRGHDAFNLRTPATDPPLTAWIRVVQPWAGSGYGVQFLPRYGMSVAVLFEDGDPDKPMIVGALHDVHHLTWLPETTHPYAGFKGALNLQRIGFRTHSHPDLAASVNPHPDGHNEFWFDDMAGSEKVYVRAENDLREDVLGVHQTEVEGIQTTTVKGAHTDIVRHDQKLTVDGNRTFATPDDDAVDHLGTRETYIHVGLDQLTLDGRRDERVFGREILEIGTKDLDPSCPVDAKALAAAQAKYQAALDVYRADVETFRGLNDAYAEWLTKLKNGDGFFHELLADIGIAEKAVDHVKDLARQVNVGALPPLKLENGGYNAVAPDETKYGGYAFAQDPLSNGGAGGSFDTIHTDTDALACGDGSLTKKLREDYEKVDQAHADFELEKSLVRNVVTLGSIRTAIELTDVLHVGGDRTEKVGGALRLQGKPMQMLSTGLPDAAGKVASDAPRTVLSVVPPDGSTPADPNAPPPLGKQGVTVRAEGGSTDKPATLELFSHAQEETTTKPELAVVAKQTLTVQATDGTIKIRTDKSTHLDFNADGYLEIAADTSVMLVATDADDHRGYVLLRKGLFFVEFNSDKDDLQVLKNPTMSLQVVTDVVEAPNPELKEPSAGVWLFAGDVTTNASMTLVEGKKGIDVQNGGESERVLSPDEQKSLAEAAKTEKAFQDVRDEAKARTEVREGDATTLSAARADQATKKAANDKAEAAFYTAQHAFIQTRNEFGQLMKDFGADNADYAKALTKLLHKETGGLFSTLHIVNTPLKNVKTLGARVNVIRGDDGLQGVAVDTSDGSSDEQKRYVPVATLAAQGPNPQHPALHDDATTYPPFDTYDFVKQRNVVQPWPRDGSPAVSQPPAIVAQPPDAWDDVDGEGSSAVDKALEHGSGSTTAALINKGNDLVTARDNLDDRCEDYLKTQKELGIATRTADAAQSTYDQSVAAEDDAYQRLNAANATAVDAHQKANTQVAFHQPPEDPLHAN